MTEAAKALLAGWGDPMGMLRLPEDDWAVAVAVVDRALELKAQAAERRR